jgi:hypothetical protein
MISPVIYTYSFPKGRPVSDPSLLCHSIVASIFYFARRTKLRIVSMVPAHGCHLHHGTTDESCSFVPRYRTQGYGSQARTVPCFTNTVLAVSEASAKSFCGVEDLAILP